jgi:hypothetical protein
MIVSIGQDRENDTLLIVKASEDFKEEEYDTENCCCAIELSYHDDTGRLHRAATALGRDEALALSQLLNLIAQEAC